MLISGPVYSWQSSVIIFSFMTCTLKISCLDLPILFGSYTFETEQKILKEKNLKAFVKLVRFYITTQFFKFNELSLEPVIYLYIV